ncbi:MAG: hypothetical protein FWE36_00145 [Erysipelotrichales bacterium]|nr:hypothetical protein [Erysipelotrichales bacterium]
MKILIFCKQSFLQKGVYDLSDDYSIILDTVTGQNSHFVINATSVASVIGDILILHERRFFYIGVITGIDHTSVGLVRINTEDFVSSLNFDIRKVTRSGNIAEHLLNLISNEFIRNVDNLQNKPFLRIFTESMVEGEMIELDEGIESFLDFYQRVNKRFGIRLEARLGIVAGVITHIRIVAVNIRRALVLKSNFPAIRELAVSEDNKGRLNKVTFLPSVENNTMRLTRTFFLLTDNTVTNNVNHSLRYEYVIENKYIYRDDDVPNLMTMAETELITEDYLHNISFKIYMGNISFEPLSNVRLGDQITFIHEDKVYKTLVTRFEFSGTLLDCFVSLGEHRLKLTEKLKILFKEQGE